MCFIKQGHTTVILRQASNRERTPSLSQPNEAMGIHKKLKMEDSLWSQREKHLKASSG
jgi:hypothetical protein